MWVKLVRYLAEKKNYSLLPGHRGGRYSCRPWRWRSSRGRWCWGSRCAGWWGAGSRSCWSQPRAPCAPRRYRSTPDCSSLMTYVHLTIFVMWALVNTLHATTHDTPETSVEATLFMLGEVRIGRFYAKSFTKINSSIGFQSSSSVHDSVFGCFLNEYYSLVFIEKLLVSSFSID